MPIIYVPVAGSIAAVKATACEFSFASKGINDCS